MAYTYIGSSNVSRFVEILDQKVQDLIRMEKCTKIETFHARMTELSEMNGFVIISVIENLLCDEVNGAEEKGEIEKAVERSLDEFVKLIDLTAKRLPGTKFAIVEPMQRPAVGWYTEGLSAITKEYARRINGLQMVNIMIVKRVDLPAQVFDEQKIHLTPASGKQFVASTIYYSEKFFDAEVVNLAEVAMEVTEQAEVIPLSVDAEEDVEERRKTLEQRLDELERNMVTRQNNDSLVFARIREELDFLANAKKEDRVVVTGLTSTIAMPTGLEEGKKWVHGIVESALNQIVEGSSNMIQFINSGRSYRGEVPVCEVKMKEKGWAEKIRKEFGKLRKEGKTVKGGVFIANSVTLATRVRLEVLRAMAKKCSNEEYDMHVMGFTSRPVLQVKRKDGGGQFVLTFVDAVVRYGGRVAGSDLRLAYERAGMSFKGQMQQNFVVLNDKGVREGGWASRGRGGAGQTQRNAGGSRESLATGANATNKRPRDVGNGNGSSSTPKRQMGGPSRGGMGRGAPGKK